VSLSELAKVCARARADGYAMDDAEYWRTSAAWPRPFVIEGLVIGSIGVSAPVTRMTQGRDAVLAQHVCDTAEHVNATRRVAKDDNSLSYSATFC
jgi:DNA-binding IclR family transcriptional regulator